MGLRLTFLLSILFASINSVIAQEVPRLVLPVGHPQGILQVTGTPNGKYIFSRSFNDRNIRIWSAENGMMVAAIHVDKGINDIIPSTNSKYLLINTGELFMYWNIEKHEPAYTVYDSLENVALSPDNQYICGYHNKQFLVYQNDVGARILVKNFEDTIVSVDFLKNDRILVVSKKNNKRKFNFYNTKKDTLIHSFELEDLGDWRFDERKSYDCIFSNNSKNIRTFHLSKNDHTIYETKVRKSRGYSKGILDYCPITEKYLIGFPDEKTIQVFYPDTLWSYFRDDFDDGFYSASFVNGGNHIAVKTDQNFSIEYYSNKLDYLSMTFSNMVGNFKNVPAPIFYQNQSNKFYVVLDDNSIREYVSEADTFTQIRDYKGSTCEITDLSYTGDTLFVSNGCGSIKKIDLSQGKVVDDYQLSDFNLVKMALVKETGQLFSMDGVDTVRAFTSWEKDDIYSITFKKKVYDAAYFSFSSMSVAGNYLLMESTGINNSNFLEGKMYYELRDKETLKILKRKKVNGNRSGSMVLNQEGNQFIYADQSDSTVSIMNLEFKPQRIIKVNDWVMSAKQSKLGQYLLITATTAVYIHDYESGILLHQYPVYFDGLHAASDFSFDDSTIIFNSDDGIIELWEINTEKKKGSFKVHDESITVSPFFIDNQRFVTIGADGFLKLWKMNETGIEMIFSMVPFQETDYATLIPTGYYQCTPQAAKLLHYITEGIKVLTFEQLDVKYNRPDKVLEAIGNTDTLLINSYRRAYEKRIKKLGIDTTQFEAGYSVPESDFEDRTQIEYEQKSHKLTLKITGRDDTYPLDRFNVWVNEVPVFGQKGCDIRKRNLNQLNTILTITLSNGENKIETSVLNVNGIESYRIPMNVRFTPKEKKQEKVYFVGIGINDYQQSGHNLQWSVKDIRDLANKLKEQYGEHIQIDTLFDAAVSRESVLALKKKLLQSDVNDKVILSFSGHGLLSNTYDYYLSTYAIDFSHPEVGGLPYEDLEWLLDSIPARQKLMLIDACHSGEVDKEELLAIANLNKKEGVKGASIAYEYKPTLGMQNSFELMQQLFTNVNKGTGATVISASGGTQFAQERGDLQNGVFTYCILELMQQKQEMKLSELKTAVGKRVEELTDGLQKPTSRNETIENDWRVW